MSAQQHDDGPGSPAGDVWSASGTFDAEYDMIRSTMITADPDEDEHEQDPREQAAVPPLFANPVGSAIGVDDGGGPSDIHGVVSVSQQQPRTQSGHGRATRRSSHGVSQSGTSHSKSSSTGTGSTPHAYRVHKSAGLLHSANTQASTGRQAARYQLSPETGVFFPSRSVKTTITPTNNKQPLVTVYVQFCPVLNVTRERLTSVSPCIRTKVDSSVPPSADDLGCVQRLAGDLWQENMSGAFKQQVGQAASRLLGAAADYLNATLASVNVSDHVANYMLHRATLRDLMIEHRTQTLRYESIAVETINKALYNLGVSVKVIHELHTCYVSAPPAPNSRPVTWELKLCAEQATLEENEPLSAVGKVERMTEQELNAYIANALGNPPARSACSELQLPREDTSAPEGDGVE